MYYFSLTLDITDKENIDISAQKDIIRNKSGSTLDNPLTFKLDREPDTESIIIKNIIIKVYKVFGNDLPEYVYEHPTNLTLEIKKDKDVEEKELEENNIPEILDSPGISENNNENEYNELITNQEQELLPNITPIPAVSEEANIKNVQTQNKNHKVADNSEEVKNNETECSRINKVLKDIDVSNVNKNDILKLEKILPRLELCSINDINAKKIFRLLFKAKGNFK